MSEDLSTLIGDIYDAALDPALWGFVLGKTRDFVGGHSATIFAKDASSKTGNVYCQDGRISEHYTRLYFEKYVRLDPSTAGQFFASVGEPISTVDLIAYDEFLETRFYQEWVQPQGLVDFATTVLGKSPMTAALFGVFRHERHGLVDDEMRTRLRLVVPHIRRAVLIARLIDLRSAEGASLEDTLDGLSAGMFLVAATGAIVHANRCGLAMLAAGDVLRSANGRLVASDRDSDQELQQILAAAGKGDSAVGTRGISQSLRAGSGGERHVAHVLPLTSRARRRVRVGYAAVAALFVHKAKLETPTPPEVIAKTFKLTPSELRVLLATIQVGGVAETAEALGISENTLKTHLRRLFDKTGTSRQAELVKLVAGFQTPLVGQAR